jgi:hypothetical protein
MLQLFLVTSNNITRQHPGSISVTLARTCAGFNFSRSHVASFDRLIVIGELRKDRRFGIVKSYSVRDPVSTLDRYCAIG